MRQGRAVLESGDPFDPVVAVGAVALGGAVVAVPVVQGAQVGGLGRFRFAAFDLGGVQRGDAVDHGHRRESVEGDVVDAGVPEEPVVGDLQDRHVHQQVVRQVHRGGVVGGHPLVCRGHRVGCAAEVEQRDVVAVLDGGVDVLDGFAVDVYDPQIGGLELGAGAISAASQQIQVRGAAQIHILRDAHGYLGRELLREPDGSLRGRQRESAGRYLRTTVSQRHVPSESDVVGRDRRVSPDIACRGRSRCRAGRAAPRSDPRSIV
ncbi:hypothetical protein L618_002000000230 [Rhodococcus rhodochrous J45]|uniref:Uncharacterized protein n=1 Tax=Rhodococcus rhodochrous J45 TaxID=935266 RepID=A0A562E496_RHORH|nr:hypothetical protein L618_002000000230 [Rhodococcus rhodochrous J45]